MIVHDGGCWLGGKAPMTSLSIFSVDVGIHSALHEGEPRTAIGISQDIIDVRNLRRHYSYVILFILIS